MTYRTKTYKQKKRLEIIIGVLFIMTVLACGVFYNYAEGLSLSLATEKVMGMFLNFMLIFSTGMALLFVFIGVGIAISKWKNTKRNE